MRPTEYVRRFWKRETKWETEEMFSISESIPESVQPGNSTDTL